jgi:[glutamine synthetase] adenylyltransferase / [glutamine synthetase]-adenylyl-L-tyrosine phosphorylase
MNNSSKIKKSIDKAWHQDAAKNSLVRWKELLKQENWEMSNESLALMTSLFGASWYFTRFCFYRGNNIIRLFNKDMQDASVVELSLEELKQYSPHSVLDEALEELRLRKNEIMLSILLLQLGNVIEQEQTESLLTRLAENVLIVMSRLFELDEMENTECVVLAMGRFAGDEMNYGSDLDLIFIEQGLSNNDYDQMLNKVRKMLRSIAMVEPSGSMYEIDMRLRPHGSSGILVTPLDSFLDFHKSERDIWERQMMTRCRVVVGNVDLSNKINNELINNVYTKYDVSFLANEILKIRFLVEQELAGGKDKIDIKRGRGGIMDIDFLTHFLQLAYGSEYNQLKSASTRHVLRNSIEAGLLNKKTGATLLKAYDFYKLSESALRVFDMKSISKVTITTKDVLPLARALGFINSDAEIAVERYLKELNKLRNIVREQFEYVLNQAY